MPDGRPVGFREAARIVAGFGLPAGPDPEPMVVAKNEWQTFVARVWGEKLTGLAIAASHGGALPLSDERAETLLERHRRAMAWCLRVEERLLTLDDRFSDAGIEYAVLKGPTIAHTAYPDPSLRGFGDLDVLVRGRDFKAACSTLRQMGFGRIVPEPRRGFDERFGKAATHRHDGDSMEIDLHRTLVLGPFGLWIKPEVLLDRAVPFGLGDRQIPRLDDTGMLLNVAMHASLGWPPGLAPLRDVLQVSSAMAVDWAVLRSWAEAWRLSAVLHHAFATAESVLGAKATVDSRIFSDSRHRRSESRALRTYLGERHAVGGTALSTLRAIPGLRDKAAYMEALAFPQQEFMRGRYSKRSYGRRLLTPARWGLQRLLDRRHPQQQVRFTPGGD